MLYAVLNFIVWCFAVACGLFFLLGLIATVALYWERVVWACVALAGVALLLWAWSEGPDELLVLLLTPVLMALVFVVPLGMLRLKHGAWSLDEQIRLRTERDRRLKGYDIPPKN